jgi:hypothetical protein
MRTVEVELKHAGTLYRARYRVSFRDDSDKAMAVMRLRPGKSPKAQAISCPEARAAIGAALAQLPAKTPKTVTRRDPSAADKPYAALAALARAPRQREVA